MALLVQTPRGTVALPPQGFFQQQASPFANQLTSRGLPAIAPAPALPPLPVASAPTVLPPPPPPAPIQPRTQSLFNPIPFPSEDDPFEEAPTIDPATLGLSVPNFDNLSIDNFLDNLPETITNLGVGFVPGLGPINTLSGLFGFPTIGSLLFGEDEDDGVEEGIDAPDTGFSEGLGGPPGADDTSDAPSGIDSTTGSDVGAGPDGQSDDTGGTSSGTGPGDATDNASNTGEEDSAEDGEGDGDGDGSFICTAAWQTGISARSTWQDNKRMYAWVRRNDPDLYNGYTKFGPWVAGQIRKGGWQWAAKIYPRSWAYEFALRTGQDTSRFPKWVKIENRLQRIFLRPIVRMWGKI